MRLYRVRFMMKLIDMVVQRVDFESNSEIKYGKLEGNF